MLQILRNQRPGRRDEGCRENNVELAKERGHSAFVSVIKKREKKKTKMDVCYTSF